MGINICFLKKTIFQIQLSALHFQLLNLGTRGWPGGLGEVFAGGEAAWGSITGLGVPQQLLLPAEGGRSVLKRAESCASAGPWENLFQEEGGVASSLLTSGLTHRPLALPSPAARPTAHPLAAAAPGGSPGVSGRSGDSRPGGGAAPSAQARRAWGRGARGHGREARRRAAGRARGSKPRLASGNGLRCPRGMEGTAVAVCEVL